MIQNHYFSPYQSTVFFQNPFLRNLFFFSVFNLLQKTFRWIYFQVE
ncbi:hypothetical protein C5167_004811 [Papaver somniferum]|uniref:Uncharacterized protein n=1 Tax=Papaver somniferum TaxID=3469 RepID=A0A4Y7J9L3_PAPSO|nr:hypothetical protein C5167_004811 [Papaver somniferum]